jgi:hypothetical protein
MLLKWEFELLCYLTFESCLSSNDILYIAFQVQHPRFRLDRFDLVVTPRHDYYALTARGQQELPHLLRRWITPLEPPGPNVVCCSFIFSI